MKEVSLYVADQYSKLAHTYTRLVSLKAENALVTQQTGKSPEFLVFQSKKDNLYLFIDAPFINGIGKIAASLQTDLEQEGCKDLVIKAYESTKQVK